MANQYLKKIVVILAVVVSLGTICLSFFSLIINKRIATAHGQFIQTIPKDRELTALITKLQASIGNGGFNNHIRDYMLTRNRDDLTRATASLKTAKLTLESMGRLLNEQERKVIEVLSKKIESQEVNLQVMKIVTGREISESQVKSLLGLFTENEVSRIFDELSSLLVYAHDSQINETKKLEDDVIKLRYMGGVFFFCSILMVIFFIFYMRKISAMTKNLLDLHLERDDIFNAYAIPLLVIDTDRSIQRANMSAVRFLGYRTEADLIFQSMNSFIETEDQDRFKLYVDQSFSKNEEYAPIEINMLTAGKESRSVIARFSRNEHVNQDHFSLLIQDISTEKENQKESALLASFYQNLVETLGDISYELNLKTSRIRWSLGITKRLGYTKKQHETDISWLLKLVHPDDLNNFQKGLQSVQQAGAKNLSYELRLQASNGSYVWFQHRTAIHSDQNHHVVLGSFLDINERKSAEQISYEYLNLMPNIFLVLDNKGKVELINPKGAKALGMTTSEVVGKDWFKSFIPSDNTNEVSNIFRQVMLGVIAPFETHTNEIVAKDKSRLRVKWHNSVIRDNDGMIVMSMSIGEIIAKV